MPEDLRQLERPIAELNVGVQAPVYATQGDVPSSITAGEIVFIDGDGLYIEDGT